SPALKRHAAKKLLRHLNTTFEHLLHTLHLSFPLVRLKEPKDGIKKRMDRLREVVDALDDTRVVLCEPAIGNGCKASRIVIGDDERGAISRVVELVLYTCVAFKDLRDIHPGADRRYNDSGF